MRRWSLLIALLTAAGAPAAEAELEGLYAYGQRDPAHIQVTRNAESGEFTGILTAGENEAHKRLLRLAVLELHEVGKGKFAGRCSAALVGVSEDLTQWLPVPKAAPLPNGDLRCTLRLEGGASVEVVFRRLPDAAPGPGAVMPEAADGGELAGAWRDAYGTVIHYAQAGKRYVGQLVELAPSLKEGGFETGDERVRMRRAAPGRYKGTIKLRSFDGKRSRWAPATIRVEGNRLELTIEGKGRPTTITATRLGSSRGAEDAERPAEPDPGELAGLWRDTWGALTRYARTEGNDYVGTIVKLSWRNQGYGFEVGEEGVRLTRTGRSGYEGKVLVKSHAGRSEWWEPLEVTVRGKTLTYVRHLRGGGIERGSAVRVAPR
jgi:hypothetical protein